MALGDQLLWILLTKHGVYNGAVHTDEECMQENNENSIYGQSHHVKYTKDDAILIFHCVYGNHSPEVKLLYQYKNGKIYIDLLCFFRLLKELVQSGVFRRLCIDKWRRELYSCSNNKTNFETVDKMSRESLKCDNSSKPTAKQFCSTWKETENNGKNAYNAALSSSDSNCKQIFSSCVLPTIIFEQFMQREMKRIIVRNLSMHKIPTLTIHLLPITLVPLDKRWCRMICMSVQERIELDASMSWLSTLGGACSALGDYHKQWADKAALISSRQMQLALRIGDPGVQSRCRLYAALALIQKGRCKAASQIIRREYDHLRQQPADLRDQRLVRMCQGIWVKLVYVRSTGKLT